MCGYVPSERIPIFLPFADQITVISVWLCDPRTNRVIIISAIDNLIKGAAGQAVQNMNLVCSLPEDSGLQICPALSLMKVIKHASKNI